jgi:hypothetical protein
MSTQKTNPAEQEPSSVGAIGIVIAAPMNDEIEYGQLS